MADSAKAVSFRKGTKAEHDNFEGVYGEITVETTTPTLYVHLGESAAATDVHGVPMACADLRNVPVDTIADKGIAKQDLSNIYIAANVEQVKHNLQPLGYANADMSNVNTGMLADEAYRQEHGYIGGALAYANTSNINTADLVSSLIHPGTDGNKPLAYKDLGNVTSQDFHTALDSLYAEKDMSNVETSSLAENHTNPLAYADLSNLDLSQATALQNVYTQGLQLTSNLVGNFDGADSTHYPSALAVKNALDEIGALPILPVKNTVSSTILTGQYRYEYSLTLNQDPGSAGTGYTVDDILLVTDNALQVVVKQVDGNGAITDYEQLDYFGNTEFTETGAPATGGTGTGAAFDITSTTIPGYTSNIAWSNKVASTSVDYNNSSQYIPENPMIGTIHNVFEALNTLGLNQQKPQIEDITVTDLTGVITVAFTYAPTVVGIKELIGGATIAGTWSAISTTMTFTPTTAADVLTNSWIITVS